MKWRRKITDGEARIKNDGDKFEMIEIRKTVREECDKGRRKKRGGR